MTRSSSSRTTHPRRGQALLLAILVMVFAALISITFITVVAVNIGQTGREEERGKAYQAAQAGLTFANLQITDGTEGLRWSPVNYVQRFDSSPGAPVSGDPDYPAYWTPFDQVQGWDAAGFVKYPDPRSTNPTNDAPNYLVKVEKVLVADPAGDNTLGDKTGDLRITTIGLSPDDPASFYKLVAYKAGPAQSPQTDTFHTVTNWDFQNGVVPSAKASGGSSGTTMTVTATTGNFPPKNFYVVIGDPTTSVRYAVVSDYNAATQQLTFTTSQSWIDGERVEIAAGLGLPKAIDFDNDSTTPAREEVNADITKNANPGSLRVNGSAVFFGKVFSNNLRSTQVSAIPGAIQVSGLIERNVTTENLTLGADTMGNSDGAQFLRSGTTNTLLAGSTLAVDSSVPTFPSPNTPVAAIWKDTGGTTLSAADKDQIVSDGWNRISGNAADSTRQVKAFTPPDITTGGDGFGRYRQLTKYSASTDPMNPQGAAYGYGQGIYINNSQDKERIYDPGPDASYGNMDDRGFREMTEDELQAMWIQTTTGKNYYRKGTPEPASDPYKSLEEQHLRGWVGPDEFRARGALVELNDDNTITITLDARGDGTEDLNGNGVLDAGEDANGNGVLDRYNKGPVVTKGWYDAAGNLMDGGTGTGYGGVYSQTFPWPANGVIYAEGNIRIRGQAPSPANSLTVVSMNNIYVEDSVGAGTKKLALLARKNVVVNPTRVLGRPDEQTILTSDIPANTSVSSISVSNAQSFKQGDWVYIDTPSSNDPAFCVKTTPPTGSTTIDLVLPIQFTSLKSAGTPVKTQGDPPSATGVPYNNYANRLSRFNQALQRRLNLPAGTSEVRLALRHSAEYRPALRLTTTQGTAMGKMLSAATFTNKLVPAPTPATDPPSGIIQSTDKILKTTYTDSSGPGSDLFPDSAFASEAAAQAYQIGQPTAQSGKPDLTDDLNNRNTAPDWLYQASVQNSYNVNASPLIVPPAYFLAAVGNRADFFYTTTPGTFPWLQDIFVGKTYDIPMATSVYAYMNGNRATISSRTGFESVKQFGFNFLQGLGVNSPDSNEDVLTTDQTFYRNGYGAVPGTGVPDNTYYTLDSRVLSNAQAGSNTLAFRLNPDAQNYFDATGSNASIPYYRLSRVKLENDNQFNSSNEFENLDPGYKIDVNAYVYAQQGSWFVIPLLFDDAGDQDVRLNYVNVPSGTGSQQVNENLDLNRDGVISRGEQAAVYRFHRYNYQINFTGTIMENQTAIVKNTGSGATAVIGAVALWSDDWSTAHTDSANFTSGSFDNNTMTYGTNLDTIKYNFDTTALTGALETDVGWHPPISPELIYQTG